jgi:5-formyltetrahydrofolate cyclo-ligase
MIKAEARKFFLEKRRAIMASDKSKWDDLILFQFQNLSFPKIKSVFTYVAMPKFAEISTDAIISLLKSKNPDIKVAYPVCDFKKQTMIAILASTETPFVNNKYGTLEPEGTEVLAPDEIDVVIVPLLCFDQQGYRVGYGKGFYDKYLRDAKPNCIKLGLSYFEPIKRIDDSDNFDVPLDYCITPPLIYEF